MNAKLKPIRRGFTLVELLVVITIIGTLVGLVFPAMTMVRDKARVIQCQNRMGELAKGAGAHEAANRRFPGFIETFAGQAMSWPVLLLPDIGRGDLWMQWRSGNRTLGEVPVEQYKCPADTSSIEELSCSYVANCGYTDNRTSATVSTARPPDWSANGVFHDMYDQDFYCGSTNNSYLMVRMTMGDIIDGTQCTLMFSENMQAGLWCAPLLGATSPVQTIAESTLGFIWTNNLNPTVNDLNYGYRINSNRDYVVAATGLTNMTYRYARPSSNHSGGVNAAFCDGHTRFLKDNMDYVVYQLLMTPDGKNARTTRSSTANLLTTFYTRLLQDTDY